MFFYFRLQGEKFSWPVQTCYGSDSGTSSGLENDDSGVNSVDSTKTSSSQATPQRKLSSIFSAPKVQFMLNDVAQVPGETSSSNE